MPGGNEPLLEQAQPFAPSDDPIAEQLAEEENDELQVDLDPHDPGPISNYGAVPQPPLEDDPYNAPVTGRPTSPPMWRDAHLHPNMPQVRVWRVINGQRVSIGAISAMAVEDEFIAHFFDNMPKRGEGRGEFVIRPLDTFGREVMAEVPLPAIDENHVTLRRIRASKEDPVAGGPPSWYNPQPAAPALSEIMSVVAQLTKPMVEAAETAREEAKAAREAMLLAQKQTADERIELAHRAATGIEAVADRMMSNESARNGIALQAQERTYGSVAAMQQAASEREREASRERERENDSRMKREREDSDDRRRRDREDAETRRDREREEAKAERDRERERWDREKEENRRRDDDREKERQRAHEMRLKEVDTTAQQNREYQERRAAQDREHAERMTQLMSTRDKNDSAEGWLEKGAKLLQTFDMKPTDIKERLFGGGGLEAYAPAIEGAVELAKTGINALVDYAKTHKTVESQKEAAMLATQAAIAQSAAGQFAQQVQQPVAATVAAAATAAAAQPVAAGDLATQPAAATAATVQPAAEGPVSKLSLGVQKEARVAIRQLVNNLRMAQEDKWPEVVSQAVTDCFAIYHYVKEISIRGALIEGGADAEFAARVLAHPALNNPVLADVPRG